MATIKPIEGRSVHQIQSGQVIVDLISVCKELVENSIDAGATSIEVRFRNNGLDAIEVQDNGDGIAPDDYATIALKHYTSKLANYHDLATLQTFGFRGEALSSLCALSKFHIVTARASDGPKGTRLDFEQSGKLKGTSVVAAKQGTTVVVETLFHNLPVRRKELEKNLKRQYSKVLELLHAYACISTGVKFNVSNQMPKGKKTVAFATNSNSNTKENIANVFGAKALLTLIPLDLEFEMDPSHRPGATQSARNWSTQDDDGSRSVKIIGHISRPVAGEGRQLPDRQMFFVNSRPCNLPQVGKAINDVYKTYNIAQSPFVFADLKLDTSAYDVNVSPDKRTIMLHDQAMLLERLRDALAELFQGHDQSVPQAQLLGKRTPSISAFKPPTMQQRASIDPLAEEQTESVPDIESRKASSTLITRSDSSFPSDEVLRPGFIKASLIERFAERDSVERAMRPAIRVRGISPERDNVSEVRVAHPDSRSRNAAPETNGVLDPPNHRPDSPLFDPEPDAVCARAEPEQRPQAVQDFNARIASQHEKQAMRQPSPKSTGSDDLEEEETGIPTITQTPQRLSQSTIQNAFDRMRSMRTPIQQATITIGDTTTVSTIGSGGESRESKRARIHTPKFSLKGTPLHQTPTRSTSNLLKSLRGFAAPGTQMEEIEDEDDQGSSLPDATHRPPSPHKGMPVRAFERPRTDEIDAASSAPPPALQYEDESREKSEESEPAPPAKDDGSDDEYIDESEKRAREEAKIAKMIAEAEEAAARPTEENLKRATKLFKLSQKKYSTKNLERIVKTNQTIIANHLHSLDAALEEAKDVDSADNIPTNTQLNNEDPEERLSLTVSKADFNNMRIIGQFNLGFILAVRPPTPTSPSSDLFIVDQHASDEKYNFERFSATTVLVSQRLVHPHPLELTAVEEEIILANEPSLSANGFSVEMDTSGDLNVGRRAKLTSLPMSKEVTFTPNDLSELLSLILDNPPSSSLFTSPHIPRPSKIRKLLASRACRGSVMIGKTLKVRKMEEIIRHMGSMDKPWSCPHGRPTMRHLFGLEKWEEWREGDGVEGLGEVGMRADWGKYLKRRKDEHGG